MKTRMFCFMLVGICLMGCANHQQQAQDFPTKSDFPPDFQTAIAINQSGSDRNWPERVVYFQNGTVVHESLYMQDPHEYYGSNDGQFKTGNMDDAWVTLASPGIFAWNFMKLPMTMIKTPPFQEQTSRSIYPVQQPVHALPTQTSRQISDEQIRDYFENQ